jgi:hypothetical protein
MNRVRVAFVLFVGAIGCGAIGGGALTGEPDWVVKGEQADQRRQNDIATIAHGISLFEMRRKELPYDLTKMAESQTDGTIQFAFRDSETGEPYDYERVDSRHYKLCANFTLASLPQPASTGEAERAQTTDAWRHPAGMSCFLFDGETPTPVPTAPGAEAKD